MSPCMAFYSITSMRRIAKKIQERALRFLLNDRKSDYNILLSISDFETLHLNEYICLLYVTFKRIHMFALEVFNTILTHLLCRLLLIVNM